MVLICQPDTDLSNDENVNHIISHSFGICWLVVFSCFLNNAFFTGNYDYLLVASLMIGRVDVYWGIFYEFIACQFHKKILTHYICTNILGWLIIDK